MKRTLAIAVTALALTTTLFAQTPDAATLRKEIGALRSTPETERGAKTGAIAREIAALPNDKTRLGLALGLAHLATEGDPGRENLQLVTDSLASALLGTPVPPAEGGKPSEPYRELASLARYEGMRIAPGIVSNAQYTAAMDLLADDDRNAEQSDFTLKDFGGRKWTKSELKGKIVVVNFWATWCPPCRVELPALDAIAAHYDKDVVVLAITDEDAMKVNEMLRGAKTHFAVLFDTGHKVATKLRVNSLPRTFIFDREGKLAAVANDGRTQRQFLLMLKKAGLQL